MYYRGHLMIYVMVCIFNLFSFSTFATQNTISATIEQDTRSHSANPVSCSLIPNYSSIVPDADQGKINNTTIAEFNYLLGQHTNCEFIPQTYLELTKNTQKYNLPIDISFSHQTKLATVTWKRKGMHKIFCGTHKTKKFKTNSIPTTQTDSSPPTLSFLDSQIPDYDAIYKTTPNVEKGRINHVTIAAVNSLLKQHGDYELPPYTYLDITKNTQKYDMHVDLSFSHEVRSATITWKKDELSGCHSIPYEIRVFRVNFIAQQTAPSQNADDRKAANPHISTTKPTRKVAFKNPTPEDYLGRYTATGMPQIAASNFLLSEFNRLLTNSGMIGLVFLNRTQANEIIALMMKNGLAQLGIETKSNGYYYLTVQWRGVKNKYRMHGKQN